MNNESIPMRRHSDMNVRPGRDAGNRAAKRRKGNAVALQKIDQRLALCAVGIERDVHRVMVIQPPLIMNRSLAEDSDWQWSLECLLKKHLDFSSLRQRPGASAIIANERSGSNQRPAPRRSQLGHLLLAFYFDQRLRNLRVRGLDLLLYFANL